MNNYVYLKCENLKAEVKTRNGIKADAKIPRLDVTGMIGFYEPFGTLKNHRGMLFFYITGTDGIINSTDLRRADVRLQCSGVNFSSVYWMELGHEKELIGYGYPPVTEYLKPKTTKAKDGTIKTIPRPNPFYTHRHDGFMFIAKHDFSDLEIIIVLNGKTYIESECRRYVSGNMNDILAALRAAAKPVFQY